MKNVITVRTMRESDAHTIANDVPSKELMYRAAMGVYRAADWTRGPIGILTGSGNNGGDGYALACILADRGIACRVYRVSEKFSEDGRYYHDLAASKGVEMRAFAPGADLSGCGTLVDCILGTGFSGQVREPYRTAIEAINGAKAYVISVDINSGLNGDSGKAELAVQSDLTVTIGFLKSGFFLGDAERYVGKLAVTDIGIRLIREDYHLAAPCDIVFPHSGWTLDGDRVELLTPGEVEAQGDGTQSLPELAMALAKRRQKLIRVLGRHALVTDGDRVYFTAEGAFPAEIASLGGND